MKACSQYYYIFSIRRSRVRLAILEFLERIYPNAVPASIICRVTGYYMADVLGALWGGVRYSVKNSLVGLGLVEVAYEGGQKLYRISVLGIECLRFFKSIDGRSV